MVRAERMRDATEKGAMAKRRREEEDLNTGFTEAGRVRGRDILLAGCNKGVVE